MGMGITLSPKYGVNPSVTCCAICGNEYGVALAGRLPGDKQMPNKVAMGLCDTCQKAIHMGGIALIEVRDGESGSNPYRTGNLVFIKREKLREITSDEFADSVKNSPALYIEQATMIAIGLVNPDGSLVYQVNNLNGNELNNGGEPSESSIIE